MTLDDVKAEVLNTFHTSTYDVRKFLHPRENSTYLEDQVVEMYKIKATISGILEPKEIFEIGIRYGYSAAALLWCNSEASYTGVDWFQRGDNFNLSSMEQYNLMSLMLKSWYPHAGITVHIGNTVSPAVQMQLIGEAGDQMDLVNVDGNHSYAGCLNDLMIAGRLVKNGGYILVDDINNPKYSEDIERAIIDFSNEYETETVVFPSWRGDTLIRVKK